jgi:hypothetical protein
MTRREAVQAVAGIFRDVSRTDRYLQWDCAAQCFRITADRPIGSALTPSYVDIPPVPSDCTEAEAKHWAERLVQELQKRLEAPRE